MGLSVLGPALYCWISGSCATKCIGTSSLLLDFRELWDSVYWDQLSIVGCQGVVGLSVLGPALYCLMSGSCGTQCIGTSSPLFDVRELWDSVYWDQFSIV